MLRPQRQPGRTGREAQIGFGSLPGHGRAATIAALEQGVIKIAHWVTQLIARQIHFGQAQLLALIQQQRAAQGAEQRQHRLGRARAKARGGADHVMVGKGDAGPVVGELRQRFQMGADGRRIRGQQQREIVAGMQTLVGRQVAAGTFELFGELAKHEAIFENLHPAADHIQHRPVFLPVGVVQMALHVGGRRPFHRAAVRRRDCRIVRQGLVVQKAVGDVQPIAVHPAPQPQVQHLQRRFARVRIHPVQLGLLAQEFVVIILPPGRLIGPGRAAEHRQPVVGYGAVVLGRGPDIPISFGRIAVTAGGEPGMFVAGVAQHFVQDDLQALGIGRVHQSLSRVP